MRQPLSICLVLGLLAAVLAVPTAQARQTLTIDIYGPGQSAVNYYLAPPLTTTGQGTPPAVAENLWRRIERNLGYLPFLEPASGEELLGGPQLAGPTARRIDFKRFTMDKVDMVISQAWVPGEGDTNEVELRVYETYTGQLLLGKAYSNLTPGNLWEAADRFCGELMKLLTGNDEFFRSTLAFSRHEGERSNIWAVSGTGDNLRRLTDLPGRALSPAFKPDGTRLVFTHVGERSHRLGIWEADTNKTRLADMRGSTVIGPTYAPDGTIALTLDLTGEPDIFRLDADFKPAGALVKSWAIDVSPSFDGSGEKMAFTSGRLGNPHIFMLDLETDEITRLTFDGKYNTGPSLSPDGRLLAFARQTPEGHRIFLKDLRSGATRQITFGPGNDEDPCFAPDGYFMAFTSNRSGEYRLYLTTRHGDDPREVLTGQGEARAPTWAIRPGGY